MHSALRFQQLQRQLQQQTHQHGTQTLTQKLRAYSARNVKIRTADMVYAKHLMTELVEKEILRYCLEKSSIPILRLEYRGSMYEGLKTEAADEADLMVVINATEADVAIDESGIPGYAFLRTTNDNLFRHSPLVGTCSRPKRYIFPSAIRYTWFRNLVSGAVFDFQKRFPGSQYTLKVQDHGPAVQLDISLKLCPLKMLLSVDLVPCFHVKDRYYVPKQYNRRKIVANCAFLWKQSFALQEKHRLQYMDREDHGCRHELLRILKTIFKKDCILRLLSSYHVKHAFLHYIAKPRNWSGENSLGDNFLGFLNSLNGLLSKGSIAHFWAPHFNLLEGVVNPGNSLFVAYRCGRIVSSEEVRDAILNDQFHVV